MTRRLVVLLALAGCTAPATPAEDIGEPAVDEPPPPPPSLMLPKWEVGDEWQVHSVHWWYLDPGNSVRPRTEDDWSFRVAERTPAGEAVVVVEGRMHNDGRVGDGWTFRFAKDGNLAAPPERLHDTPWSRSVPDLRPTGPYIWPTTLQLFNLVPWWPRFPLRRGTWISEDGRLLQMVIDVGADLIIVLVCRGDELTTSTTLYWQKGRPWWSHAVPVLVANGRPKKPDDKPSEPVGEVTRWGPKPAGGR